MQTHAAPTEPIAVVALNMGGPATLADVEPFLEALFADPDLVRLPFYLRPYQRPLARRIARKRGSEAKSNYRRIGGGSPLLCTTEIQVQGITDRLRERGIAAHPFVSMRYSAPRASAAVAAIRELGARIVVALSLYPQFSPATGGSSLADLRQALEAEADLDVQLIEIARFGSSSFYLDAMADSVKRTLSDLDEPLPHVLFSAHGIPLSYVERGDPYHSEILESYDGVVARLPRDIEHSLAFQSRVGRLEWLRPYTDEHLAALAARGTKRVLMVPLGFVSDHVETLYEMDLLYGELARTLGIAHFSRAPALNADAAFLAGLADLVADHLAAARGGVRP